MSGGEAGTDYSEDGASSTENISSGVSEGEGEESMVKTRVVIGNIQNPFLGALLTFLNDEKVTEALKKLPAFAISVDNIFNLLDALVPGIKGLQADLVKIFNIIRERKLISHLPEVMRKKIPTLKKILGIIASGKEPTEKEYISLGKSLNKIGGPYVKDLMEGLKEAPLQSLHDKLEGITSVTATDTVLDWMSVPLLTITGLGSHAIEQLINIIGAAENERMKKRRF